MKNILITGGAGYIGSHTVGQFLKNGYQVVVYDNLSTGFESAIPKGVTFVKGDVLDTKSLAKCMQEFHIEAVIHFAAKLIVPESVAKPALYYHNNVGGMCSLLFACEKSGVKKIVFSSTAAVYGIPESNKPISELTPTNPINPYGQSKLMAEKVLTDFAAVNDLGFVILRYFNVAGASDDGLNGQRTKDATHLIKVTAEVATGKRPQMSVFGFDYPTPDGTCIRDYIHVEDLSEAHVLAARYLEQGGVSNTFNCGYGRGFSVLQVIETLSKVSNKTIPFERTGRRAGDPPSLVADSSKLKTILGWKPKRNNLELICKSAFEWEQKLG
jgi:UDP-glucose 4-epimerase